jgi:hypothetical protein
VSSYFSSFLLPPSPPIFAPTQRCLRLDSTPAQHLHQDSTPVQCLRPDSAPPPRLRRCPCTAPPPGVLPCAAPPPEVRLYPCAAPPPGVHLCPCAAPPDDAKRREWAGAKRSSERFRNLWLSFFSDCGSTVRPSAAVVVIAVVPPLLDSRRPPSSPDLPTGLRGGLCIFYVMLFIDSFVV